MPSVPALSTLPSAAAPLPRWPRAWYVVARSRDVPPRGIASGALAEREWVLFRTAEGRLAAFDAHCPHMGAHLEQGEVQGERLRCPLHHWTLDGEGTCRGPGAGTGARRGVPWPVEERLGLIFLYPGRDAPPPLPIPERATRYAWTTGRPVTLDTDWHSMMVNGFDFLHLEAVHHRTLVGTPELEQREGNLRLRYESRVAPGGGLSDWVMKTISRNRIRVQQVCHGPVIVVESDLGRARTAAVLGLLTEGDRVRAFGAFGSEKGAFGVRLRLWMSRWLFSAFLRKDFAVVERMRLRVDVADPGVRAVAGFLRSLKEVGR